MDTFYTLFEGRDNLNQGKPLVIGVPSYTEEGFTVTVLEIKREEFNND